jgi:hypothetical protein
VRIKSVLLAGLVFVSITSQAAENTAPIEFAKEYIREMGVLEDLRSEGATDLKEKGTDPTQPFVIGIHSFTRTQNALRTNLSMLKGMKLAPPNEDSIKTLTDNYTAEINIYERMIGISTVMLSDPNPKTDYGALMADMPKLRADLEDSNQSLFQIANLVFAAMIDMKPDKNNHVSHLTITCEERQSLIDQLNRRFGSKLDQKGNLDYFVSGAWLLRANLKKDFKCSDQPW